jgi:glycine/D-amino acid oxidase-like deaminating enzyme
VGATYNWTDKNNTPTQEGMEELLSTLKSIIQCDFEVVNHFAGVRPTVNDRRPLVGEHPIHNNIYVLNGLGTRGVFLGPSMAKMLFDYIEFNIPIDFHADIKRFKKINWFT